MKIRKATTNDLEPIASMMRIPEFGIMKTASNTSNKEYLQEFLEKGILIVAEENTTVIGFIAGEWSLGGIIWINLLAVNEHMRGQGIGQQLISRAIAIAREKKYYTLYLAASSPEAVKFYRKFGLDEGEPLTQFSLDLTSKKAQELQKKK